MAYDDTLAKRISNLTKGKTGFVHEEIFGGIGYLINGNTCVGIHKNDLIIRYNPKDDAEGKKSKFVRHFDITGRLKGSGLKGWFDLSFKFAKSLPTKK